MTRKGAQMVIDSLSIRFAQIQEIKERLSKEENAIHGRILALTQVEDPITIPVVIVNDETC